MPRYVALLRGVMPQNLSMSELRRTMEGAGFTNVRTILASGNVAFDSRSRSEDRIAQTVETALEEGVGRNFPTIVRATTYLQGLVDADPWQSLEYPSGAKRVVTFLRSSPTTPLALPLAQDGTHILAMQGLEIYSAYLPNPKGPVFMTLIEKAFRKEVTTRTWDTVIKCAKA